MHKKITYLLLIIITLKLSADDILYSKKTVNFKTNLADAKSLTEIPFPIKHYAKQNNNIPSTIIVSHFTLDNMFITSIIKNHRKYAKKHGYDYWFRNGIIEPNFTNFKQTYINNPVVFFGLPWQKSIAIKQAMNIMEDSKYKKYKYEWIMWIDGHAAFTDINKSLEDLKKSINLTEEQYLVIAKDASDTSNNICNTNDCINTGVLLIRNNNKGRQFIQNIIDSFPIYKDRLPLPEQAAFQDQIFGLMMRENNNIQIKSFIDNNKHNNSPITGIKIVNPAIVSGKYTGSNPWKPGDFIVHFTGIPKAILAVTIVNFFYDINNIIK